MVQKGDNGEIPVVGFERDETTSLVGIGTEDTGMLDAIDLPIIVITGDFKIACINRAATTLLGLTASHVGCPIGTALAGVENLERLCAQVIADAAPCRFETRDGHKRFLVRISPYTGSSSQILGLLLTFTNVTAFRASIDQAIYEREYTKAILNTVIDPLVVLDSKLQVQTANRAFYTMFGVSRQDMQGASIRKLGSNEWETSEVWKCIEPTLSAHAQLQDFEINCEFPAIGRRTLLLDARRVPRDGDALILLSFQDVTERKQAERTTSLLASIVGSSDDAIVSKTLDGTITSWNKSAERLFGYTAAEAIGQRITLIVPWERRSEEEDILRRLARGERFDHFETVRRRKDGSELHVSLTISPIRDVAGRVIGASKVARDISERKLTEQSLRESEERLRLLAETLDSQVRDRTNELEERNAEVLRQSDELRILSFHLLKAQDDERKHLARELHDSAGQTLVVLGMNLQRIAQEAEQGAPSLAKEIGDVRQLLQQLNQDIRTTAYLLHPPLLDEAGLSSALRWYVEGLQKRSGLRIELDIPVTIGRFPPDMELLVFRLVQECLTNIHRHSGSKSAKIRVAEIAGNICVEVQDEGKGISPAKLVEIQTQGSGVGIRGMRERLRQFQGKLSIKSSGSGTRVSATIPVPTNASPDEISPLQAAI